MYDDSVEPENVMEGMICRCFMEKYNGRLCALCYDCSGQQYDTCWYTLPMCLETNSLAYTLNLIQQQQIYELLKKKRIYGVTFQNFFHMAKKDKSGKKKGDEGNEN